MILNPVHSSQENHRNSSKYSPTVEFLILQLDRDNDMMIQHHRLLDICVKGFKMFYYFIQCNIYYIFVKY